MMIPNNREHVAALAEMTYADKESKVSEELKKRIDQEYLEFRDLHADNWQMRDKLAYDFKACRDLY